MALLPEALNVRRRGRRTQTAQAGDGLNILRPPRPYSDPRPFQPLGDQIIRDDRQDRSSNPAVPPGSRLSPLSRNLRGIANRRYGNVNRIPQAPSAAAVAAQRALDATRMLGAAAQPVQGAVQSGALARDPAFIARLMSLPRSRSLAAGTQPAPTSGTANVGRSGSIQFQNEGGGGTTILAPRGAVGTPSTAPTRGITVSPRGTDPLTAMFMRRGIMLPTDYSGTISSDPAAAAPVAPGVRRGTLIRPGSPEAVDLARREVEAVRGRLGPMSSYTDFPDESDFAGEPPRAKPTGRTTLPLTFTPNPPAQTVDRPPTVQRLPISMSPVMAGLSFGPASRQAVGRFTMQGRNPAVDRAASMAAAAAASGRTAGGSTSLTRRPATPPTTAGRDTAPTGVPGYSYPGTAGPIDFTPEHVISRNISPTLLRNTAAAPPAQTAANTRSYFELRRQGLSPEEAIEAMRAPATPAMQFATPTPTRLPGVPTPITPAVRAAPMPTPQSQALSTFLRNYRAPGSGGGTAIRALAAAQRAGLTSSRGGRTTGPRVISGASSANRPSSGSVRRTSQGARITGSGRISSDPGSGGKISLKQ